MCHGPDGHDLRDIARRESAQATLQDVVAHLDHLPRIIRVGGVRHKGWAEVGAVRPRVVVHWAAAGAVLRGLDEGDEVHIPVPVRVVLGEVDGSDDILQGLAQPVLHACERVGNLAVREQPIAVGAAGEWAAAAGRRPSVRDLVVGERRGPVGQALDVQQAVRQLLIVCAVRVGATERRRRAVEQHVIVVRRQVRRHRTILEPQHDDGDVQGSAHDLGRAGLGCPRQRDRRAGRERDVQRAEGALAEERGPIAPHLARPRAPHAVRRKVEPRKLAARSAPPLRVTARREQHCDQQAHQQHAGSRHTQIQFGTMGNGNCWLNYVTRLAR